MWADCFGGLWLRCVLASRVSGAVLPGVLLLLFLFLAVFVARWCFWFAA